MLSAETGTFHVVTELSSLSLPLVCSSLSGVACGLAEVGRDVAENKQRSH